MNNEQFLQIIGPNSTFSKSLAEAAKDPECQFSGTWMFVDICGSTAMKQSQAEQAWLPQLGWFYETVAQLVEETGVGFAQQYSGDGILLATIDDNATKAVSLAIRIQEAIADGNKMNGFAMGEINFNVSIGVASGVARIFRAPDGLIDFAGIIVDKTSRLCGLASPRAIFIDPDTRDAAHMGRLSSRVGEVLGRRGEEYLGERIRTAVKGISESIEYFEVLWEQSFFGVKNEAAGEVVTKPVLARPPVGTKTAFNERRKFVGKVKVYGQEKGFGFLSSDSGEDFYLSRDLLVYPEDEDKLVEGAMVVFVAADAVQSGRSRQATAALVVGESAEGQLTNDLVDRRPGWIGVKDKFGHQHLIFMPVTPSTRKFTKGAWLSFVVGANDKGGFAQDVVEVVDDEAA
ncbi:hypothetical protein EU811_22305 [Arthrobacter sp. TS-15]|uniref:adenylate/guanylate cyclase domain-containing protein n=1 Tax=Arthrobacter sp. TS-15 TaxID=2510797 RepID=UPI00115E0898|nr:adenylate/guanylate cyclase domain-containing protein [Arthrobacter sp. TS-15]TQS87571.1 hypothetical protein EU811_22305 [Arthrobacter sp. TS-15]